MMVHDDTDRNFQRGLDALEEIDVLTAKLAVEMTKLGETFETIRRREERPDV